MSIISQKKIYGNEWYLYDIMDLDDYVSMYVDRL